MVKKLKWISSQLKSNLLKKEDDYNEVLGYELSQSIKNTYKWFYDYFGYI